jgi:hypothetical protein
VYGRKQLDEEIEIEDTVDEGESDLDETETEEATEQDFQSEGEATSSEDEDDSFERRPIPLNKVLAPVSGLNSVKEKAARNGYSGSLEEKQFNLPPHFRCTAHLLNLVATADVGKGTDRTFTRSYGNLMKKLKAIWRKQRRSSKASDFIMGTLKQLFVIPNATRWNSVWHAKRRVKRFALRRELQLRQVFNHFKVKPLTTAEIEMICEYVKIMKHVVHALDALQGDKKVSMGYLLPTIYCLKNGLAKLERENTVKHCSPLLTMVMYGIDKRFDEMFHTDELRLAAMTHPRFKLSWIPKDEQEEAIGLLKSKFELEKIRCEPQLPIVTTARYFVLIRWIEMLGIIFGFSCLQWKFFD